MNEKRNGFFWGGVVLTLALVGVVFVMKGRKAETRKAVEMRGPSAGDVEDTRVFVLRTMVKDLNAPDAPKGNRLVAALGIIRQVAAKGDFRGVGTPEDEALAGIVRRLADDPDPAIQEAAKGVLEALPKGPRVTTRG